LKDPRAWAEGDNAEELIDLFESLPKAPSGYSINPMENLQAMARSQPFKKILKAWGLIRRGTPGRN